MAGISGSLNVSLLFEFSGSQSHFLVDDVGGFLCAGER